MATRGCKATLIIYTEDVSPDDKAMLISERHCFLDVLAGLSSSCNCGMRKSLYSALKTVVPKCMLACVYTELSKPPLLLKDHLK